MGYLYLFLLCLEHVLYPSGGRGGGCGRRRRSEDGVQRQTERLDDGAEAFILTVQRFLRKHSTKYYIVL